MKRITSVGATPTPTIIKTRFWGRSDATFSGRFKAPGRTAAPNGNRAGMVSKRPRQGAGPRKLNSTQVRCMAAIIIWPSARLMTPITPLISVMPMPIRT